MGADGVQVTDETVPISPSHFQGGYLDFVPHEYQMITKAGPPRTSMLDDLCFYIKLYTSFIGVNKPESVVLFAKKIVASHYLQHAEFLRSIISTTQFHMSRKATIRLRHFSDDYVETQWSDSQALVRRNVYLYPGARISSVMLPESCPQKRQNPRRLNRRYIGAKQDWHRSGTGCPTSYGLV